MSRAQCEFLYSPPLDLEPLAREIGLAEVLLTPRSELISHTIREARFREDHGLSVLGILRKGQPLNENLLDTRLEFGDSLLVGGGVAALPAGWIAWLGLVPIGLLGLLFVRRAAHRRP